MPIYRFHMDVDVPPHMVAQRLKAIVHKGPTFWESLRTGWWWRTIPYRSTVHWDRARRLVQSAKRHSGTQFVLAFGLRPVRIYSHRHQRLRDDVSPSAGGALYGDLAWCCRTRRIGRSVRTACVSLGHVHLRCRSDRWRFHSRSDQSQAPDF